MEHKTEGRVGVQFDFGEFKIWLEYGLLGLIILEFLRGRLAKLQKMITLQLNTAGGIFIEPTNKNSSNESDETFPGR